MILVAGATGMVGSEVCRLLTEGGKQTRALIRPTAAEESVRALTRLGVKPVEGDVRDQRSLVGACTGVDMVISTLSSMPTRYEAGSNDIARVDRDGVMRLIDIAAQAKVRHFVFISFTADLPFPLRDAKREVERHLVDCGMPYTILRSSYFMEVWLTPMVGFDAAKGAVRIFGTGERPVSFISYRDVARFAVQSLEHPFAHNSTLSIGGPEAIAPQRIVEICEEISGRPITVENVTEDALLAQEKAATDPMQRSFAALMRGIAKGDPVEMEELTRRFGLGLTSVGEYLRTTLLQAKAS